MGFVEKYGLIFTLAHGIMKKDFDYRRRGDYDYDSDSQNEFDILIKSDRFECSHNTQNEIAIVISNSDLRHHLKHSRKGFNRWISERI